MKAIVEYIIRYEPKRVHVVLDIGRDLKKKRRFDKYKSTRGGVKSTAVYAHLMDKAQHTRLELARRIITRIFATLPIHFYTIPYIEGDTICGGIAMEEKEKGENVVILTGDKDHLQMVDDNIKVVMMRQGKIRPVDVIYSIDNIHKIWGACALDVPRSSFMHPSAIPFFRGLIGDDSDAISGVKGVGPKAVSYLINVACFNRVERFASFDECESFFKNVKSKLEAEILVLKENKKKDELKAYKKILKTVDKVLEKENLDLWKISWDISDIRHSYNTCPTHGVESLLSIIRGDVSFKVKDFLEEIVRYEFDSVDDYKSWLPLFECVEDQNWNNLIHRSKTSWFKLAHLISIISDKLLPKYERMLLD